jgi:predicted  nucleic acid-binding Zn-ribbon protein
MTGVANVTRHLDTIVELQSDLTNLRLKEKLLDGVPGWMQELHDEHSRKLGEIQEYEQEMEEASRQRRAAEDGVEDCQAKLQRFQEQMGQVRTQREYGALLQEIDEAKRQIKEYEEAAIAAMGRHDEAQQKAAELREAFAELDAKYAEAQTRWDAEKPGVAKEAEELKGRIEVLNERLPRGKLSLFRRLLDRHEGQALATIHKIDRGGRGGAFYHCAACNYRVRPQAVVEIRNQGSLVMCDSCKRILHFAEEETD